MVFEFFLGGYFRSSSYHLRLKNTFLAITIGHNPDSFNEDCLLLPFYDKEWEPLIEFLKACNWDKNYDSDILDGTQWELKTKGKGFNIKSFGSNAYPDDFEQFLTILNKIIGNSGIELKI